MARIRTIKPEFFKHGDLFDLEKETGMPIRIAFAGLWTCCDREGRFKWRPRELKTDILPHDELDFSRVLDALATRGFIEQYELETGELFGFVPSFLEHQVINNRESQSLIPCPFDACSTRDPRGLSKNKGKGRERKGKEEEGKEITRAAFALPDWINADDWNLWIKTRKGKKMLPEQMQAQVEKLRKWKDAGLPYWEALRDSASNGWQGLFEPKVKFKTAQDSRLDFVNQVMGNKNGTDRQIRDITGECSAESDRARIPEIIDGLWESNVE